MNELYRTIGISKQAVEQYERRQKIFDEKVMKLVVKADDLREAHPGCGVEKMYYTLRPDFIGRDRFVETFMSLGYRLKKTKNYRITTRRGSWYYPNLIEGISVSKGSEIWQSDLTYVRIKDRFYYVVFIIDVYTKKIVGYSVSDHMRATANIQALKMALKDHDPPKIHHSDRGSQYIHNGYINLLKKYGVKPSMGKIAQENSYAERINGTIKNEFIKHWKPQTFEQLKVMVKKAVRHYNRVRPHDNLGKKTPEDFSVQLLKTPTKQGESMTIFEYQKQ
jgi:hypothetical protein